MGEYRNYSPDPNFTGACERLAAALPGLPQPLRHHLERLLHAISSRSPSASAMALKDSAETLVRLCFTVTAAEVLRLDGGHGSRWQEVPHEQVPEGIRVLASFVCYASLPTMGSLYRILDKEILATPTEQTPETGLSRRLAELWNAAPHKPRARLADLVRWRNESYAHGALGNDAQIAAHVVKQLPHLEKSIMGLADWLELAVLACEDWIDDQGHLRETPDAVPLHPHSLAQCIS